ncbi:hypothetical protein IAQ61_005005 [Plenodomus lingam]|uniref:SnoaL-like domain-containing protein n=1 Tax=Leptosphaeria maculans (strain JN3 / isolate v23.1.3 / race Av1-4-5-6-7-8) TaxID=985895 RepID=M1ZJJ0_LEPMJ|nr:hypothetical protein IAQ61_005005 [Plenodomus lingam]CCT61175.1 predicted protein [Plenodomus lingam JN3]
MRVTLLFSALLAPLAILAAPVESSTQDGLVTRQARPVKPAPCVRVPGTTEAQTKARSEKFAHAFIYKKDISEAFSYIVKDYINHNPAAQNGSDSAWNLLSPIWASQNIKPIRTTFINPQSWLNYETGSFGTIVDRFRWEGGCIVEHWDQGEQYPNTTQDSHASKACPSPK